MDIGTELYNARRTAALTQEQVAEALNISRQTLSNWENGKTYPDILKIMELSELYGITLDTLLKDGTTPSDYAKQLKSDQDYRNISGKRTITITAFIICAIWLLGTLYAWIMDPGYDTWSAVFILGILPLALFIGSAVLGCVIGIKSWPVILISAVIGILACLFPYGFKIYLQYGGKVSFSLASLGMLQEGLMYAFPNAIASAIGIVVGLVAENLLNKKRPKE